MIRRLRALMSLTAVAVFGAGGACGQDFPSRPVRIYTSEPGGGNDFAARLIAQGLTGGLGQQVVVENRGAAGGVVAAETVARAQPDGYSLLFYGSNIWLLPFLRKNVPYDPVRDFSPVTLAVRATNILVVHPSLPVKSVQELIALARARPGDLNYGSGAIGSSTQIASVRKIKGLGDYQHAALCAASGLAHGVRLRPSRI